MAESGFSESDALLIGACIRAATSIAIARHLHAGAELERQIAERALMIYQAVLNTFPPQQAVSAVRSAA